MPRKLDDWMDPRFVDFNLKRFPAPKSPQTGLPVWEKGIRLHGAQERIVKEPWALKQLVGGVRFGKSFTPALMILLDILWRATEAKVTNELWGVVGDTYSMAQEEMKHIHRLCDDLGIPHTFSRVEKQPWSITFPHTQQEVVTLSASDITKIASRPYRAMVIAEANQTIRQTLTQAQLRVLETGGWVLLEGTLEQADKGPWYAQLWREWQERDSIGVSYSGPSWENQVVFPLGREDPRILAYEQEMLPGEFREKIAGEPSAPADAAVPEARKEFHVKERYPLLHCTYDPELPVELAVDPGSSHAYACLAIQSWGNEHYVFDAIYRWNRTSDMIVREAAERPWAKNVRAIIMDRAAKQRNTSGDPDIVVWRKQWPKLTGNPANVSTHYVPIGKGYNLHRRALLNAWPEAEAQRWFNQDGTLTSVTNPEGPKLYFSKTAAAPFFGGYVDGVNWGGEYLLHHNRRNREGIVTSPNPVALTDDAIKALNYWFYARYDPAANKQRRFEQDQYRPSGWGMAMAGG